MTGIQAALTMSVDPGDYDVVGFLDISNSLLEQKEDPKKTGDVYKYVVHKGGTNIVVYASPIVPFGRGSVIRVLNKTATPVLGKDDYVVVKHVELNGNETLVERMLEEIKEKG